MQIVTVERIMERARSAQTPEVSIAKGALVQICSHAKIGIWFRAAMEDLQKRPENAEQIIAQLFDLLEEEE